MEGVLPIELIMNTWTSINWKYPMAREELLAARIQLLDWNQEVREMRNQRLQEIRLMNKKAYDKVHWIRKETFEVGDIMLCYEGSLIMQWVELRPYKLSPELERNGESVVKRGTQLDLVRVLIVFEVYAVCVYGD
ncbi:hypothetical protein HK104_004649, partial [Borealophlyctis nickersoniae]